MANRKWTPDVQDAQSRGMARLAMLVSWCFLMTACTAPPSQNSSLPTPRARTERVATTESTSPSGDTLHLAWRAIACGAGGFLGYVAGKAVDKKRSNPKDKNSAVMLALLGCVGADALAGTIYARLSENGRRAREQALVEAAQTGRVQRYKDDLLTGTVTPGKKAKDPETGQICVPNTDYLADGQKGDKIVVKMCQQADGGWAPVVA